MAARACAMAAIMVGMLTAACMAQHAAEAAIVQPLSQRDVVEASALRFRQLLATPITTAKGCTCIDRWQYHQLIVTGCGTPDNDTKAWCRVDTSSCDSYGDLTDENNVTVGGWDYCKSGATGTTVVATSPKPTAVAGGQTIGGCTCKASWSFVYLGNTLTGEGCANPDNDPKGDYCVVDPFSCKQTWQENIIDDSGEATGYDYCVGAAPSPATGAATSKPPTATPAASRTATPAASRTATPAASSTSSQPATPAPSAKASTAPGPSQSTPVVASQQPNGGTNDLNANAGNNNAGNSSVNSTPVPSKSAKKSHTGAIVGAVVGVIAGLILLGVIVGAVVFIVNRNRSHPKKPSDNKRTDLPMAV